MRAYEIMEGPDGLDWGSMSKREFKRREMEHELGHEDRTKQYSRPPAQAKPDIKMTHLHYFNVSPEQAASAGLKKDRNGKFYLPQYNLSGGTFRQKLADLAGQFGAPKTVTLKS